MKQEARQVPRGGSTTVDANGEVKHTAGTLNPGDKGYREAVTKVDVKDKDLPGTVSRVATFRDLEEKPPVPAKKNPPTTPSGGK